MHPDFKKNGYLVARDFFDKTTISLAQTYFDFKYRIINFSEENRINAEKSIISLEDKHGDIATSYNFYSDQLIESIHLNYGEKTSKLLQINLSPTYTFTRIYEKNDYLLPHIDRPSCEVSATCPITVAGNNPSILYISNYKFDNIKEKSRIHTLEDIERRGDYTEIELYPGDALFYSGCDRYHWRKPLQADYLVQFFMHFVETNGVNKDWYFDKRPYSGFPESRENI